ncbi:MAG: hypothetical protein V1775_00485 [Bacteroidota bacterium]
MITVTRKPPVVALCDNVMFFEFTTNLPQGTENVYLLIQPWYALNNDVLGTDILFPAVPGSAVTDLHEYLRTGLFAFKQFVFPEQGNVPWSLRPALIKEYKLKIQEIYFANGQELIITSWLEQRFVLRGKIPEWKKQVFYAQNTSFLDWQNSTHSFLTFSPKTLITSPSQMQKLGFFVYWNCQTGERLNLKIDVVFTDSTVAGFTTTQQSAALTRFAVVEFAVGYSILNLPDWSATNHPGKTIAHYSVTAMSGSVAVSETRTYLMDYRRHIGSHQFIFANSIGYYDTFLATGETELNSSFEYDNVNDCSLNLYANPEKFQFRVTSEHIHTCRSGFMSAEMALYMAEFFESFERYEVIGSSLIPVVLFKTKTLRARDNENMFFVEFEYQHTVYQKVETE